MSRAISSVFVVLFTVLGLSGCGGGGAEENIPGSSPSSSIAPGTTATLTWTASSSEDVVAYRIYYGNAPGSYLQPSGQGVNAGSGTSFTVTGLTSGRRYYFVARSYDAANSESGNSNEVFKDMP